MALRDYARLFRNDTRESAEETKETASEILAWAAAPYHAKFLAWLDAESGRPIKIANEQLTVLESAVRANTLREVRQYIVRITARAEAALAERRDG